jgi:hypothetical protein
MHGRFIVLGIVAGLGLLGAEWHGLGAPPDLLPAHVPPHRAGRRRRHLRRATAAGTACGVASDADASAVPR